MITITILVEVLGRYSNPNIVSQLRQVLAGEKRDRPSHRPVPSLRQKQTRLTPDVVFDLAHDYQAGITIKQLVSKYGISRTTVMAHLKREGIQTRYNKLDGKLEEIKELRAEGWSYVKIGRKFGVTARTVRRSLILASNEGKL